MILNSYAKLNLYLEVLKKRKDNYHDLKTIFERIDLSDRLVLKSLRNRKIKIICKHPDVPIDESNLCYQSAKILQDEYGLDKGVEIRIIKRIPVGAGLGGGSSNAATALLGLNQLWKLRISGPKLVKLAQKIGSDVPFFLYRTPFAQGSGRGDLIRPLNTLKCASLWHILIVPRIKVSTPLIYRKWDEWKEEGKLRLTKPEYNVNIINLALKKEGSFFTGQGLFNSLEEVSQRLYPEIRRIKGRLLEKGIKSILMSGSGPAVFGICFSGKEAVILAKQLKAENKFWQVFVSKTI